MRPTTLAVVALLACCSVARAADAGVIYRAGTDSGMRYLAEHAGRLRVTLLLQECGLTDMAQVAGAGLPNSVQWFLTGADAGTVQPQVAEVAAQITRAYLLGFEVGVRTEFQRQSDEGRLLACNAAAAAAEDFG